MQKQPPEVFYEKRKKVFLKISQNSQENTCGRVSFFIKETLAQMFFCEISKNTFFTEYLWMTAAGYDKFT